MSVYQRSFKPYDGAMSSERWRFLIPARYALKDLFRSKLFIVFTTLCFIFPLLCIVPIYVRHNADVMAFLVAGGEDIDNWVVIDEVFFGFFMRFQGTAAFLLVLFSGPRLVSRDLANNGLALYLCRPFSKTQYVAGKATVLALLERTFLTFLCVKYPSLCKTCIVLLRLSRISDFSFPFAPVGPVAYMI